jgi:flagellar protein FliS
MSNNAVAESAPNATGPHMTSHLVVLLHDGAIGLLRQAAESRGRGDPEGYFRAVGLAVDVIAGLRTALDVQNGGEIAEDLDQLYGFMIAQLQHASFLRDGKALTSILRLLEPLYHSWQELDRELATEADLGKTGVQHEIVPRRAAG